MSFEKIIHDSFNSGDLQNIIANSNSLANVCRTLNYSDNGRNTTRVREFCIKNDISIKHFTPWGKSEVKKEIRICPVCNKEFEVILTRIKSASKVTCSHGCANTYFRSGINAGGYKGKETAGRSLIKHSGLPLNCCAVCNETEVIDLHHIDEDRSNNAPSNFVPLCPTHHAYIHRGKVDLIINELENFFILHKNIYINNQLGVRLEA